MSDFLGLSVFARMRAHPGRRPELVAALHPFINSGAAEPGTSLYLVHESLDDPDVVWFFARFTDRDALATHQGNEAALVDEAAEVGKCLAEAPQVEYGEVRFDKLAP